MANEENMVVEEPEVEQAKPQKKGKRTQKLVNHLVLIALLGAAIVAVFVGFIGIVEISNAYKSMTQEELRNATRMFGDVYGFSYPGDWALDEEGLLFKGEQQVSENYALIDDMKTKTSVDFTVFYGPTRYATSLIGTDGKRIIGTDAADSVIANVLQGGNEMFCENLTIAGQKYDAYYIPMKNSDGTVVGMYFAGRPIADVNAAKTKAIAIMIVVAVVIFLFMALVGLSVAKKTSPVMSSITRELTNLSEGSLTLNMSEEYLKRKDELGDIAESVFILNEKLGGVIRTSKDMSGRLHSSGSDLSNSANQASEAARQVTDAVDDVSKGAISQAESVTDAASDSDTVGVGVDHINDNVEELNTYTQAMEDACRATMETLEALIKQSNEVQASVTEIGRTIDSTNQSAKNISEFSQAIKDIAEQTNLLSLNASIEAARAGESGRGFAVVATEIGQLAVQSSESAEKIGAIVEKLLQDAAASVDVMKRLNDNFGQQAEHLDTTKTEMQTMADNVQNVASSSNQISEQVKNLESAKDSLVGIIADLSAVSQENAAATEETNASMAELNSSFTVIADSASDLLGIADNLEETISYFHD